MSRGADVPIKGFIETSFIDWKGHLASVVFTAGCNFRCPFCHNRDLVLGKHLEDVPIEHILGTFARYRNWVDRVVVTGGEPTLQDGLLPLLRTFKDRGMQVKLDTNGSRPEVLKEAVKLGLVDYVAMDVKGPLADYHRWCGVAVDTAKVGESIDFLLKGLVNYEFRMTVVPFLHREADVYGVARMVKDARRFFVQEFVPRNTLNRSFETIRSFTPDKMEQIREGVRRILSNAALPGALLR